MNISEFEAASGTPQERIRYYESEGMIGSSPVTINTIYSDEDLDTLHFIQRTSSFGLNLDETKELLSLWQNKNMPDHQVKEICTVYITKLTQKIEDMNSMKVALQYWAQACEKNEIKKR
jgi:DNA-binding transcriptional MerR regulator